LLAGLRCSWLREDQEVVSVNVKEQEGEEILIFKTIIMLLEGVAGCCICGKGGQITKSTVSVLGQTKPVILD
jgi:hypothetical protein